MSVKAFELSPAVERVFSVGDKSVTKIECIECCGRNLYIGTSDCFVIQYKIEERMLNGRTVFTNEKLGQKQLSQKKPVLQLKAASALNRVIVLCDAAVSLISMLDLEPVQGGARVKNVTSFCLNENPIKSDPFSVEICVALRKKQIHIYNVTEDKVQLTKSVDIPEPPLITAMDGNCICVAMATQYMVVNYENGRRQELFPYNPEQTKPLVERITKDEFLLSAPSALGMFASPTGISQRPPLQWSDNLVSITYAHPYILALNDEFITVHSILDQQQKQSIPFQGGQWLGEFDGRLYVASHKEVYGLVPIAIEKQIQALLEDKRVAEALALAKNARKTGYSKDQFMKVFQRIQQQAGFIEFAELHFDEALELFRNGGLDVRELITLYPNMLPSNSSFTRSLPPLHEIADVNQLSRMNSDKVHEFKNFLLTYLEDVKTTRQATSAQEEIDTALMKLYAEENSPELIPMIVSESRANIEDCVPWLERFKRHHALALLQRARGDNESALTIWTKIADGELSDELFPGIDFIVEFLANLSEATTVWKYVDWVLTRDQEKGVKIFTQRPENDLDNELLKPDAVVDYLHRFPRAHIMYLEHLIFERKIQKESYHTHLAILYTDQVMRLMKEENKDHAKIERSRVELRHLLQTSDLYRVQLLLGKIRDSDLHTETAILYGKLGDHEKALEIFVHKLQDFEAAEEYCMINTRDTNMASRQRLYQTLLGVYLDPNNERREALVAPAVALLNNNKNDFDAVKVLKMLPDNWSIGLLSQFLVSSVRKSMNHARTTRVERMLARGENLATRTENIQMKRGVLFLGEERACAVCSRVFTEPSFVRYPNGVVTHISCAKNKNVCPITGKLFNTTAPPVRKK